MEKRNLIFLIFLIIRQQALPKNPYICLGAYDVLLKLAVEKHSISTYYWKLPSSDPRDLVQPLQMGFPNQSFCEKLIENLN